MEGAVSFSALDSILACHPFICGNTVSTKGRPHHLRLGAQPAAPQRAARHLRGGALQAAGAGGDGQRRRDAALGRTEPATVAKPSGRCDPAAGRDAAHARMNPERGLVLRNEQVTSQLSTNVLMKAPEPP